MGVAPKRYYFGAEVDQSQQLRRRDKVLVAGLFVSL